ncbi:hypothetical protein Q4Q35_16990 [Flavivirga aquimarina]|uniref:STAS/SEC14 domain-containing protein n=1 Tax=Flavivirga aquimarina TaxID=2027862 RepID=A0ABT8WEE1_9FLAO|nr:hypothetical protein [Flavivirga aquimarina]MDO5971505.1 hypothetical protein [Flavivirga aquimarina]
MKFEDSNYYNTLISKKVVLQTGTFYFSKHFCISEINEGVHLGFKESQEIIIALFEHYGENLKIGFISNRINSYSIDIREWVKLNKTYNFLIASAIVVYDDLNFNIAEIEKYLSDTGIKKCNSLNQAIDWISGLKEFKTLTS